MTTTLPSISGVPESRMNPEQTSPSRGYGESALDEFTQSVTNLASMDFPDVNPDATIKARIHTLECTIGSQSEYNKGTYDSFINLNSNLNGVDQNIKELLLAMQNDFDDKLAQMRKEYDHRFELQNSENKRMQNHVATLKADTNQLKRKLQSTVEKLRKLQREFGEPDDIEEESSVMSPNTYTSRPNTTGF